MLITGSHLLDCAHHTFSILPVGFSDGLLDGLPLQYGPQDNQGSDAVFVTILGEDGQYRQVEKLDGGP